jgi:archaeosine synthase
MNPIPGQNGILTMPSFYHPAFEDAYRFIITDYRVPAHEICIFLPCSMKKPFSTSPSHRIFDSVIASRLPAGAAHRVVFGTCGVVPRELERMFPFTHYRYMLGKCTDERIKRDFYRIETPRLVGYLRKTRETYRHRVAYCLGGFRKAMIRASEEAAIPVQILPTDTCIRGQQRRDLTFTDGSLHMEAYLLEFGEALAALAP